MAAIITVLIAASLPRLEFQPGLPLPELENDQVVIPAAEARPFHAISIDKLIITYVLLLVAGSVLYMTYKLLRGAEWKNFTALIWPVLLTGLILGGFAWLIMLLKIESAPVVQVVVPMPEPPVRAPLGAVPLPLLWLVGGVLLAVGILIGIWIISSRASSRNKTMDIVRLEAEKAWQELKTGLNLKDVIIKCYRQMSLALEKEQGIERKDFMTTREFENLLEAAGVPHDPVHQLTRLFEAVRYGNWQPNPPDEQKAIQCLEAIVLYSRKAKEANQNE
ncbi:MAG TPA: DUF4129 domain-containing protein [Anaerolineales bacterium]|nr:DUF4129 domain-containing protein [Anaerolineales bacterium]